MLSVTAANRLNAAGAPASENKTGFLVSVPPTETTIQNWVPAPAIPPPKKIGMRNRKTEIQPTQASQILDKRFAHKSVPPNL